MILFFLNSITNSKKIWSFLTMESGLALQLVNDLAVCHMTMNPECAACHMTQSGSACHMTQSGFACHMT